MLLEVSLRLNRQSFQPNERSLLCINWGLEVPQTFLLGQFLTLNLAISNRNKKKQVDNSGQYYIVIVGFVVICVAAVLYMVFNPKESFGDKLVVDEYEFVS